VGRPKKGKKLKGEACHCVGEKEKKQLDEQKRGDRGLTERLGVGGVARFCLVLQNRKRE